MTSSLKQVLRRVLISYHIILSRFSSMSPVCSGAVTKLSPPKKVLNNLIFFGVWCWRTHSSPRWNDNTSRGAARSWKQIKQVVNGKTNPTRGPVQVFQLHREVINEQSLPSWRRICWHVSSRLLWKMILDFEVDPAARFSASSSSSSFLSSTYPQSETFGQERTKDRTKSENMRYLMKILWGYFTKQKERS